MNAPRPVEGLTFQHYGAAESRGARADVERIFLGAYVETIESGEDFESREAFMDRFDAYTDPARSAGFDFVMARLDGEPCGQAWGWPLGANSKWWGGLRLDDDQSIEAFSAEDGRRTFALSEIMVRKEFTGR